MHISLANKASETNQKKTDRFVPGLAHGSLDRVSAREGDKPTRMQQ